MAQTDDIIEVTAAEFRVDLGPRVDVSVCYAEGPYPYTTEFRDAVTGRLIGRRVGHTPAGTALPEWRYYLRRKEGNGNG
jgi:hypothetical protein